MAKTARQRIEQDPIAADLLPALCNKFEHLDGVEIEEKATSFHVVHGRAFAGIHPRKGGLLVNVVLDHPIDSERTHRVEQVSAKRWHNELVLKTSAELDGWIAEAHRLTTR
jgi:hypothetical protein